MSSANAYLTVGGLGVDVVYKDIKNLHISVYPPMGRVRVAAPERLSEEAIRLAVVERLPWIGRLSARWSPVRHTTCGVSATASTPRA